MSTLSPTISLSQAYLQFKHKVLFENLSFELRGGQITCLLGPSGVGKTTLLRLLAGLPLAGRGENRLQTFPLRRKNQHKTAIVSSELDCRAEIEISDGLPLQGRLGYMAQTDLLLPWLSLLDNVMLGSYLRGQPVTPALMARAQAILMSVGLQAEQQHKPHMLSSGMKQRTALARTLMEDHPIILMDEPFSALDAITRYDMQTLTAQKLQGKTVLLITHDPWEAIRLGQQIFILRGQPAKLSLPISAPMLPPRDITDPALLPLQKKLLRELHLQVEK